MAKHRSQQPRRQDASATIELADAVFGAEVNEHLLWEVVKAQLAKRRAGTHSTKRRDEVRGGGKKLYKQKGTGHARQGSIRAPHYVGGGKVVRARSRATTSTTLPRKVKARRAALARCRCAPRSRSSSSSTASRSTTVKTKRVVDGAQGARRATKALHRRRARQRERSTLSTRNLAARQVPRRPRASTSTTSSATSTLDPHARTRSTARRRARLKRPRRKKVQHDAPRITSSSARSSPRRARVCARPAARPRHVQRGDLTAGPVRGRSRREQDRDQSAVETLFKVKVVDVHTLVMRGKEKRMGRVHRPAPELEEGDRDAARRATRSSSSRESRAMAIKNYKPTSPGRRGMTGARLRARSPRASPRRALLEHKHATGGRNNHGRITVALPRRRPQAALPRHRLQARQDRRAGQGRRRSSTIRTAPRASRCSTTPTARRRYILAPDKLEVGDTVISARTADIKPGNSLPLRYIPLGTDDPQRRAARSARGGAARPLGRHRGAADGEGRRLGARCACRRARCACVHIDCRATIGQIGNTEHANIQWGKAGRTRWLGKRPHNRGVTDEPRRSPDGRWRRPQLGWPSPVLAVGPADQGLKTRHNKRTDKFIIRRRGAEGLERWLVQSRRVRSSTGTSLKKMLDGAAGAKSKKVIKTWSRRSTIAPGDGRPHVRGAQRPQVRPGVRHREHGRPQARRVRADPHVPRPPGERKK